MLGVNVICTGNIKGCKLRPLKIHFRRKLLDVLLAPAIVYHNWYMYMYTYSWSSSTIIALVICCASNIHKMLYSRHQDYNQICLVRSEERFMKPVKNYMEMRMLLLR